MGRLTYVCKECSEHFTQKYSAKRHNRNLQNSMAEIVRLPDYLVGRQSGRYKAGNPFWHKRNNPFHKGIWYCCRQRFQPRYMAQLVPPRAQYSGSGLIHPPMDDQRYGTGLSQETKLKIEEFKRLMHKYSMYHPNLNAIITMAVHWYNKGDNKFLDEKLEHLRTMDILSNRF